MQFFLNKLIAFVQPVNLSPSVSPFARPGRRACRFSTLSAKSPGWILPRLLSKIFHKSPSTPVVISFPPCPHPSDHGEDFAIPTKCGWLGSDPVSRRHNATAKALPLTISPDGTLIITRTFVPIGSSGPAHVHNTLPSKFGAEWMHSINPQ
ncbi:hypothetical protein TNIN_496961 [Trichonephila inaurata madagascariensis]|uniref:Uncharacterized protein n=1 Tax=Trichonephila inaurata madagascariensis TaxID=2747483 RepID=A0A8X6X5S8_9ARAC|nr:hypothetical protein TNIN_496961 [Trichonephila inaurata madagascariensis]